MRDFPRAAIAVLTGVACATPADRGSPSGDTADAAVVESRRAVAPSIDPPAWSAAFGDLVVFIAGDQPVLLRPGASGLVAAMPPGGNVVLLSRSGASAGRWVGASEQGSACRGALAVTVDGAGEWGVGLADGTATPLALTGLDARGSADSARITAELTRLVAALPADSASAFGSVPFVLREAATVTPDSVRQAVAAVFVRTLAVEADPRSEFVVLIAERPAARPRGGWTIAYLDRAAGPEDAVPIPDLLAAVRMTGTGLPTLFVRTDGPDGTRVHLVERAVAGGRWRERWRSEPVRCG